VNLGVSPEIELNSLESNLKPDVFQTFTVIWGLRFLMFAAALLPSFELMRLGQFEPVATNLVSLWSGLLQDSSHFGWISTFAWCFQDEVKKSKID
jgi:hypothetical protein